MNNIFSIYWFQSNKSCAIHSGNTNTVAHLGNSCGVRSRLSHRSLGAPRLDDGISSYHNPGNSFTPWFLKGQKRCCLDFSKFLCSWTLHRDPGLQEGERNLCLCSVTKIWWKNQLCYFVPRAKTNLSYASFALHLLSSALFCFES